MEKRNLIQNQPLLCQILKNKHLLFPTRNEKIMAKNMLQLYLLSWTLPSLSVIFPEVWTAAVVDPRLKKSGQAASLTNLRPVSNLQFISKLTERAVCDQTVEHVSRSGLYPLLQSAYRAGHSTETALLKWKTISYWLRIVSTSPSSYFSIWVTHSTLSTTECCYVVLKSLMALRELLFNGFDHTWLAGPNECT